MNTSMYQFIKMFMYDFKYNNEEKIGVITSQKNLKIFEDTAVFLSMMVLYNEGFCAYRYFLILRFKI